MHHATSRSHPPQTAPIGDPQRELAEIEAALARDPANGEMLLRAARWGAQAGLDDFAAKFYAHAAALGPLDAGACAGYANALRQLSRHDEAVSLLQDAIGRMPQQARLWLAVAAVMQDLGDDDGVESFLDEAVRLAPDDPTARLERAALRHKRGKLREAREDCSHVITRDPRDIRALSMRGDVDLALGETEAARTAYLALIPLAQPGALRDRLERLAITEFDKDLPRSNLPPAAATDPVAGALRMVFFHADARAHGLSQVATTDYHGILAHSIAVARRRGQARVVMLTDRATQFDPGLGIDELVRSDVDPAQLMYERMRLQRDYLADADGAAIAFLDSDVLVNRSPAELFREEFDVGLLWRTDMPDAPFVGGSILARGTAAARRFFDLALDVYRELECFPAIRTRHPDGIRRWWGDQYALAAVVGWRHFARRTSERMQVDGAVLRFLPEREVCRVPVAQAPAGMIDLTRPCLIHFKGNRKAAMARMAARLLQLPG